MGRTRGIETVIVEFCRGVQTDCGSRSQRSRWLVVYFALHRSIREDCQRDRVGLWRGRQLGKLARCQMTSLKNLFNK